MPPIAVATLATLAAVGAVAVGRLAMREFRRVNAELDEVKTARDPVDRSGLKTLRRDPVTGEYRPQ
jgi:hypothetical protein